MLDKALIGRHLGAPSMVVEAGAVRNFARAIGETDPIYTDLAAARAAGLPSLRVPPTFLFCLQAMIAPTRDVLEIAKLDLARILHAEQGFTFHAPAFAGDTLTFDRSIVDVYDKKGGALEFLVMQTRVTNQSGAHVADLRASLVQRQIRREGASA